MNLNERQEKVAKVIKQTLQMVLKGSMQETTLHSLVKQIDEIYEPLLIEETTKE